jgi:hypothetical protein
MSRLDRRSWRGRYARDRAPVPEPAVEPPAVGSVPDWCDGSSVAEAWVVVEAEAAVSPERSPGGVLDAPHGRQLGPVSSSGGVIGRLNSGEVIAAGTAAAMLTGALQRLGLRATARGGGALRVCRLGVGGRSVAWRDVLLGHHPGEHGRLWWWLLPPDSTGHASDGVSPALWPADHPIGPMEEVAAVAEQIARMLTGDGGDEGDAADRAPRPANDWGLP